MATFVIAQTTKQEIIVEKSRFIACVAPIDNEIAFLEFKKSVIKAYPGARHYPYAYRFGNMSKSSDDGEPSGTAGRPLLELINTLAFDQIGLIVVRYFGGTKLGAGRLLRTYVDAAKQALLNTERFEVIPSTIYETTIKSANLSQIEYLFNKLGIEWVEKKYLDEEVYLRFNAPINLVINDLIHPQPVAVSQAKLLRKEVSSCNDK